MTEEVKAQRDITVARPFRFTYRSGEWKDFGPGIHLDVGDEVADHWFTQHHLLRDGERISAPIDVSDPAATAKRVLSLEDQVARLQAEVRQAIERAERVEADLADARTKSEDYDAVAAERDALKSKNEALTADVARLTKAATPAAKPTGK